jgi:hypothetical protein
LKLPPGTDPLALVRPTPWPSTGGHCRRRLRPPDDWTRNIAGPCSGKKPRASARRDYFELEFPGRGGEAAIVGDDCDEIVSDGEGGGDVNGVERTQLRRLQIGCGFEDLVVNPDQGDAGENLRRMPSTNRRESCDSG